jgi:hypothetical protein
VRIVLIIFGRTYRTYVIHWTCWLELTYEYLIFSLGRQLLSFSNVESDHIFQHLLHILTKLKRKRPDSILDTIDKLKVSLL